MGSFGVNFNFDFGNLKLDKLFDDANKSGKANLSSNQIDVSSNYNANSANNYSGNNKNSVETMDFSSKVNNKNQSNSINISNNNSINNTYNETNSNIDSSKVNINTQNNNNQNFSTLNQNSPNQNTKDSNVNVNSKSTSDMKNNISNSNVSTNNMDNSNSTNNQNISVDTNSSKVDITSNNSKNDIDISKNSSTINNTSTNSSSGSNSATMNNSSNISTGNNNSSIDVSINMDNQETSEDSDNMTVKDGKVIIVTTDQSGNQVNVEIDVEDYKSNLKVYGFTEEDINRIISGEISPEKLLEEIQSDSDNTRRKKMMESSYLQAYGLNFNDMSELKNACVEKTKELEKLLAQRANVDNNRELDSIMNIVTRLKMGESLDNILKSEIVAWKYTDENGNTCYRYDDPYINGNYDGITYESLYFSDMYQDSEILKKLQNVLSVETIDPLFGDKYQVQRWTESDEQQKFFDDLAKKYSESIEKRQSEVKKLDEKITELQQQKETYEYVYNYIDKEVNYYLTNIDTYTSREDFYLNNSFNSKCLDKVNELNKKYNGIQMYDYSSGISNVYINDKTEIVDIISCMINGKGNISNGYLSIGTSIVQLSSRDDMLAHYEKWLPFVTENEIQVFNYIYNTQGTDKAYEYLENISDELDNRWLANKTQEDQEFASEHPILASIGSIVVTPIEGISAVCYSMNSYFTGEKIRRADVYSAGDVWRGQVSQDIAENYGEGWAFVYSTGMSMADSASLIGLSLATGGVATPVLSATLMGSRAYVSTLNDSLDRGLSDGSAILLASTSAIVETAMESYSVGHLLNLESKLGKTTLELTSKIANNIGNETVANLVTKSFYISASALSQGLAEGEEEFATEILNYVADIFIAKDLSNYTQSINQYLKLGYSEDQALLSTMKDFSNQAFQAFLGGFVSGVCFGSFAGTKSTIETSYGVSNKMYNDLYGNKAQQFAQSLEINRVQQEMMEQEDKEQQTKKNKQIIENITTPLTNLSIQSTAITLLDIKKATLGTISCIPAFFNKFRSATLVSNQQLMIKISNEGLLHLTTEEAAKKIVESGYVKASKDPIVSYGKPKSFFFAGIPSFGNVCLNLNTFREKAVAVRIKPSTEILNNKKFNYRAYDDFAIMHSGNFNFEQGTADIVYLGLIVNDVGEFEYKEITKDEYDNYTPNTESISRDTSKAIKKLADTIKGALFGLSYQYDVFVNNELKDSSIEDNYDKGGQQQNKTVIREKIETRSQQSVSDSNSVDNLISEIDSKILDLESEELMKSESITNPQIAKFISYFDDFKEKVKNFTGKTDEELSHFNDFRAKIISYGSIEQIIENLDSFDEWEMKRLLNVESPIVAELFNHQKIINYVTENMSRKDIMNYSIVIPSHPIIESTFLSLTNEEVEEIGSWTILNEFKNFSLDTQKQFVDYHEEFFVKELDSIFYKDLNKDAFMIIFNKVGSFEFLQSNKWSISNLSSEIQNELYNKYKEILYTGTQKQFIEFAEKINDPDYQTQFIKNSPFYAELINSTVFSELLGKLKSKEFILELIKSPDGYNKMINSPSAFKNVMSLLTINEQQNYKAIAKDKIIALNKTTDRMELIWASDNIYDYIKGFSDEIQTELLNDKEIVNSFSIKTLLKLNNKFDGYYLEKLKEMINGDFDSQSAKLLFEPEIYQLMDQETINRAASALSSPDYNNLAKLGNQEAIDIVIDKIIANNFSEVSSYYGTIISLYEAADDIGRQKIVDNITFNALIKTIGNYKGEQFADILVEKLTGENKPTKIKITDLRTISQYKQEAYEKVIKCLSTKEKFVAFNYENIMNLGLESEFVEIFRDNPELINYMDTYHKEALNFLKLLKEEQDLELFYNNITVKTLLDLSSSKDFDAINMEKIKNILMEGLPAYTFRFFNEYSGVANILTHYSLEEQMEILNTMEIEDKYFLLLNGNIKTKDTKFEMIKMMLNDSEFRTSISDDNIEYFKGFFDSLEAEYTDYIMNNASNHFLGFMLTITKRNDLNLKFKEMINENILILNEFEYSDAELIYGNLSLENRALLDTNINNIISSIGNLKVTSLLEDATTAQKSAFLDAYNKGLINDEKIELLIKIKSKNRFVLSTFNYSLFDETIYQFGDSLLTKLSKYYDVVSQIEELKKNPQKFNLFAQFVINDTTSSSPIVADQKMAILLNYLLENDISPELLSVSNQEELETARNIILKQIDQFSILDPSGKEQVRDRSIIVPDSYTLKDYDSKLAQKCDSLLKEVTTVTEVQNLIFNKYFSISIEDATELFRMYGSRFVSIKGLDTDGIATTYLENMKNILNMSMEEAIDYYNSFDTINRYSMNDTLNIINEIKQIYTKSLKSTLFNPTEITGYVEYEGKQVPIYQPKGDFQMLIQSTYTNYGGMPMINDNYFDSWNLSSRTANHGICCSLISNNNMGMAMVKGPGVVIGFNNFSDEQMNMMAPYDIYTRNDGYVIKCQRPLLYLPGQDVMNETRHTHNEFNLERTNLTGEGELANIQPDYVVVFEEMSEEKKQNAYKASVEFNVPLVYINKNTLAETESAKIDGLISEYKNTGKVELLKDILILHENNRSGYRNPTDSSLVTQYFSSDRIISVLNEAIESITIEEDLQYIKEFLEDEIRKFDTTLEATHRANEIDIDAKGLIEKIDNKLSVLADIEATKDMEFLLYDEDVEATARLVSIGNLIEILTNDELFIELQLYDEYKTAGRKLISSFNKTEYLEAFMQLYNTIKKNNYNLGFNEQQNKRLEFLYNEAIEKLDISKIQYSEFLADDLKLKIMFKTNKIYSYKDLFILYNYYLDHYMPEILYNNPTLIYSNEFKFYVNTLGRYVSNNSNALNEIDIQFWNNLETSRKDCENIIIEDKIDVGEQEFQNLISNIHNWHQTEREYVDYFTSHYDVDVSNLNYDSALPDSLKIKIMIKDNIIYDRNVVINEFNKIITKESILDYNLIFNDLFMFYFKNISTTLTPEEANKTYSFDDCNKLYSNSLNKIINENIDILEDDFIKLLSMIKISNPKVENYINNYLDNHKEINLSSALDSLQYSNNLPLNLKNKIITQILSEYDWFILQNSSNVYGSDQNAISKYIQIQGNNLDWLSDENDFINYLITKREYNQNNANKLLQDLKSTNGVFTINDARTGSILIEYIFDKCARENRFDVLDIFERSFTFQYNSEINRLGNKLMNQGMSYVEALRTLCAIDSTGCCSYASVVNSILLSYKNNAQAFENDFGYPLYVYIDGKQEFNAAELLLDMYIYLNSNRYVDNHYHFKGNMFKYDQNGALHIDELNTNNQVYLSGYTWHNLPAINSFLASKKSSLSYKIEYGDIYGEGHTPSTRENVVKMKEQVINYLKQSANNSVEFALRRTEEKVLFVKKVIPFRFMTKPGEVYVTTKSWNEGGGHAVCVTGVLDDYFVVSSWGKRLLIPIEDFTNNNFNVIFRNMEGIK